MIANLEFSLPVSSSELEEVSSPESSVDFFANLEFSLPVSSSELEEVSSPESSVDFFANLQVSLCHLRFPLMRN